MRFKGDFIHFEVCNSLLEPLSYDQIQKLGMNGVDFKRFLYNDNGLPFAYVLEKNEKLGAFSIDGKQFADFIYDDIEEVTKIHHTGSYQIYKFKYLNSDGTVASMDIYDECQIVARDVHSCYYCHNGKSKDRHLEILNTNMDAYMIYDAVRKDLNPNDFNAIHDICEEFQKVICYDTIYDFDGKQIVTNSKNIKGLHFTDVNGLYKTEYNHKFGLAIENDNDNIEEIIPSKMKDIKQVFKDRIIVQNIKGLFHVIQFEKKNGKWIIKQDNYKLPKTVTDVFFLEDESEAIITFKNGKKILLSHYLLPDNEKYECAEIIYEGNEVFKCFKFEDEISDGEVTYMWHGQAIGYSNSKDRNIHILKQYLGIYTPNSYLSIFGSDGKRYYYKEGYDYTLGWSSPLKSSTDRFTRFFDFMTVEKENNGNVVWQNNQVINGITQQVSQKLKEEPIMLWHNLYWSSECGLCSINELVPSKATRLKELELVASFNDNVVLRSDDKIYISNREGSRVIEVLNGDYHVDKYMRRCVCYEQNYGAFVVSNEGVKVFTIKDTIVYTNRNFQQVSKDVYEGTNDDFVIGGIYITKKTLAKEINEGIIDSAYRKLL